MFFSRNSDFILLYMNIVFVAIFLPYNMMNVCLSLFDDFVDFLPYVIIINRNTLRIIQRIIFSHFISSVEQLKAINYFSSISFFCCQSELDFQSIFSPFTFINPLNKSESFQISILNASNSGSFSFVLIEYICQMIEYTSEKTIIQRIAVIRLSTGIQVRFKAQATMKGRTRLVAFFNNHCHIFFDSMLSHKI